MATLTTEINTEENGFAFHPHAGSQSQQNGQPQLRFHDEIQLICAVRVRKSSCLRPCFPTVSAVGSNEGEWDNGSQKQGRHSLCMFG